MAVVTIDANVLFSALVARSTKTQRRILMPPEGVTFVSPKFVLVEIFKYKERIAELSSLAEADLLTLLNSLLNQIEFIDERAMSLDHWREAWDLCGHIDEKDVVYVALTLDQDGQLWTRDQELIHGLRRQGFDRFYDPAV